MQKLMEMKNLYIRELMDKIGKGPMESEESYMQLMGSGQTAGYSHVETVPGSPRRVSIQDQNGPSWADKVEHERKNQRRKSTQSVWKNNRRTLNVNINPFATASRRSLSRQTSTASARSEAVLMKSAATSAWEERENELVEYMMVWFQDMLGSLLPGLTAGTQAGAPRSGRKNGAQAG